MRDILKLQQSISFNIIFNILVQKEYKIVAHCNNDDEFTRELFMEFVLYRESNPILLHCFYKLLTHG